jgi:hypothetical protein
MCAVLYVSSLEVTVCSEREDEKPVEHCRLSQRDRTQAHTEEVQRQQRVQTKLHITVTRVNIMTILYSYTD